jgi:hypothetical protein
VLQRNDKGAIVAAVVRVRQILDNHRRLILNRFQGRCYGVLLSPCVMLQKNIREIDSLGVENRKCPLDKYSRVERVNSARGLFKNAVNNVAGGSSQFLLRDFPQSVPPAFGLADKSLRPRGRLQKTTLQSPNARRAYPGAISVNAHSIRSTSSRITLIA